MNKKSVTIKNLDWNMAGDLYFPDHFDETKKYPAIVSAHPIGSSKEQTAGNIYGQALAQAGFLVLAFDASFQGESGGKLRHLENPGMRTEDFSYAVDYLVTLDYVDEEKIGVLGICGGGAYTIDAAKMERRFKAIGTVTAASIGRLWRETEFNPIKQLEEMAKQRTAEARGAEIRVDNALPDTVEVAKKMGIDDIDPLEAIEYYRTPRGQKPNGTNLSVYSHSTALVNYDPYHLIETLLTQPLLVIVGDKPGAFGAYRDGFEIIRRAGSKEKELFVLKGWSHYDLYDQPEPTRLALEKLVPFYKKYLG
ncbi:alpha/beta hydrolase [Enterococcus sp. ALS3]|uniref:Alpha/beta hydrolase n=1 Tax=Enterococcus alishanensis TaxID=1303817 RepID=A0ABS6TH24_9ENTE|nr:alpha/beta hydrolase [Enterococcus alishanensis]MBV7392223.1 alpha/beta hydrolase [Enterococcus alishanensis]